MTIQHNMQIIGMGGTQPEQVLTREKVIGVTLWVQLVFSLC